MKKRMIAFLFTVGLFAVIAFGSAFPVFAVNTAPSPDDTCHVSTWEELTEAIEHGPERYIVVDADIVAGYPLKSAVNRGITHTLDLNGHKLSMEPGVSDSGIQDSDQNYFFINYGTLTITDSVGGGTITPSSQYFEKLTVGLIHNYKDLTISGGRYLYFNGASAPVMNEGTLRITDGTFMYNTDSTCVIENGEKLVIEGGTFKRNYPTVCTIGNNGKFRMSGGVIKANKSFVDRTAAVFNNASFVLEGGEIYGEKGATDETIYNRGTFRMTGGTVHGGIHNAVYNGGLSYPTFIQSGGKITKGTGLYESEMIMIIGIIGLVVAVALGLFLKKKVFGSRKKTG